MTSLKIKPIPSHPSTLATKSNIQTRAHCWIYSKSIQSNTKKCQFQELSFDYFKHVLRPRCLISIFLFVGDPLNVPNIWSTIVKMITMRTNLNQSPYHIIVDFTSLAWKSQSIDVNLHLGLRSQWIMAFDLYSCK